MQIPFHSRGHSSFKQRRLHSDASREISAKPEVNQQHSSSPVGNSPSLSTNLLDVQSISTLLGTTNNTAPMAVILSLLMQLLFMMQAGGPFQIGTAATQASDHSLAQNGSSGGNNASNEATVDTDNTHSADIASGTVRASNGHLLDSNGNNTVLKGYNVWNTRGATLTDSRLNSVRVNMADWHGADRDASTFIAQVKAYATANPDKTVIMGYRSANSAGDINPSRLLSKQQVDEGIVFWQAASKALKNTPNVIFNLENELGTWPETNAEVFGYYREWIPAARSGGATNPILIGSNYHGNGAADGQAGDFLVEYGAKLKAIDPEKNIIGSLHPYSVHSYDRLVTLVQNIKGAAGIPVIADEVGEQYGDPNAPQIIQQVAVDGYLDGLLFWGGADLVGEMDEQNYEKNWQPFLASLSKINPTE